MLLPQLVLVIIQVTSGCVSPQTNLILLALKFQLALTLDSHHVVIV